MGSTLVLEFIGGTAGTTGDYNDDGTVDAADYTTWQDNLGTNNPLANDPIGGTIGQSQYTQWKDNFGNTASSSATAVPEPSAGALLGLGVLGLGVLTRWGRRQFAARALTGRFALTIIILFVSAWIVGIETASAETFIKVETFDVDPGWTGLNNRGLYQDFGINQIPPFWIVTHLAEGANPGEIGGSFATNTPAQFPAYFADDIGSIDPRTEVLTMAGKAKYYGGTGQLFYGWFDKDGTLGPFWNADQSKNYLDFMGVMTDDESFTLFAGTESRVITPKNWQGSVWLPGDLRPERRRLRAIEGQHQRQPGNGARPDRGGQEPASRFVRFVRGDGRWESVNPSTRCLLVLR